MIPTIRNSFCILLKIHPINLQHKIQTIRSILRCHQPLLLQALHQIEVTKAKNTNLVEKKSLIVKAVKVLNRKLE